VSDSRTPEQIADVLLELGGALLSAGCPTHRLEHAVRRVAELEGLRADVFAVPTGLFLSVGAPDQPPLQRMRRVREWGVDLGRLAAVDQIFNDILDRRVSLTEARHRLDGLEQSPSPYPPAVRWLAAAGTAGATAVFFRGGVREIGVAAAGGLLVAWMRTLFARSGPARLLQDFLGGLLAGLVAWGAWEYVGRLSREVVVLSIVILLVPGLALTTGLSELVHRNLVSGASKLMEAGTVLLSIVIGIASAIALERMVGSHEVHLRARPEPGWLVELAALAVSSLSVAVLFSVPRRLLPGAMASVAIGWIVAGLGGRHFAGAPAAFCAAFAVALFSNALARFTSRPSQVFVVPGLVLLVPGSFGFLSLDAFLEGELAGGAAKGFEMFLVAGSIVTGLLVASVLLPARKIL